MCGRFQIAVSWDQLVALYGADSPPPDGWAPTWSVCPTHAVPTLRRTDDGQSELALHRWGFPMPWLARTGGDPWSRPLINAKAEEAPQKRTWAKAFRDGRCMVPASAFIEWYKDGKKRFPLSFSPDGGGILSLAALWSRFPREGEEVAVVTLLTTAASPDLAGVHDRMPVILPPAAWAAWMDPATPDSALAPLLAPAPPGTLTRRELPTALNKAGTRNQPPEAADWSLAAVAPDLVENVG